MSNTEFIARLIANRDAIRARHNALVAAGNLFAAQDMAPELSFATRAAHDALMGR
jgi:hypothetical protein